MSEFWTPVIPFLIAGICVKSPTRISLPPSAAPPFSPTGNCSLAPYLFLHFTCLSTLQCATTHQILPGMKEWQNIIGQLNNEHLPTSALWMDSPSPGTQTISSSLSSGHYYQSEAPFLLPMKSQGHILNTQGF
ncbi:hypothetical protein CRENBAI_000578 [Crenichthys baileyi]|uniref:Uncharacterized protein n=1 Tax=Crenichthys baileyi TaxID=28760 RepID=A0AAV9SA44_9TELE